MAETSHPPRGRWTGLLQVLRYNQHLYALAAILEVAVVAVLLAPSPPGAVRLPLAAGGALGFVWSVASLAVSHHVYDRSALYRWRWLADLALAPASWVNIHAGLDDTTGALAALYGASSGRVLDIFSPGDMPEPSIARARRERRDRRAEAADHRRLPLGTGESDAIFLLFAAHELRRSEARVELFREAARALRPGGRLILVEHLRDAWNFAAFGPGFLHFFPASTWRSAMAAAGLPVRSEFTVTPFVRVFVGAAP